MMSFSPVSLIISHVEFHDILFAATDERRLQPAERRPAADLQRLPERHELPELVPKRHSVEVALHPVAGIQPSFDQPVDDRRIVGVEAFVGLGRRVSREVVEREGQFDPAPFAHLRPRQTLLVIDIGDITVGRIAESRVIRRVVVERLGGILLREQRRGVRPRQVRNDLLLLLRQDILLVAARNQRGQRQRTHIPPDSHRYIIVQIYKKLRNNPILFAFFLPASRQNARKGGAATTQPAATRHFWRSGISARQHPAGRRGCSG